MVNSTNLSNNSIPGAEILKATVSLTPGMHILAANPELLSDIFHHTPAMDLPPLFRAYEDISMAVNDFLSQRRECLGDDLYAVLSEDFCDGFRPVLDVDMSTWTLVQSAKRQLQQLQASADLPTTALNAENVADMFSTMIRLHGKLITFLTATVHDQTTLFSHAIDSQRMIMDAVNPVNALIHRDLHNFFSTDRIAALIDAELANPHTHAAISNSIPTAMYQLVALKGLFATLFTGTAAHKTMSISAALEAALADENPALFSEILGENGRVFFDVSNVPTSPAPGAHWYNLKRLVSLSEAEMAQLPQNGDSWMVRSLVQYARNHHPDIKDLPANEKVASIDNFVRAQYELMMSDRVDSTANFFGEDINILDLHTRLAGKQELSPQDLVTSAYTACAQAGIAIDSELEHIIQQQAHNAIATAAIHTHDAASAGEPVYVSDHSYSDNDISSYESDSDSSRCWDQSNSGADIPGYESDSDSSISSLNMHGLFTPDAEPGSNMPIFEPEEYRERGGPGWGHSSIESVD